ncbi:unnamed protein product [Caenorhabditis bovis]|uniref:Uncharacterized protein n=1 Tax=Caenorhabditis bovis TaxID=2654633 RepID=A0A8S1ES81_9PELO|nr:unnamed protein product [Caenorhabditis bovis]
MSGNEGDATPRVASMSDLSRRAVIRADSDSDEETPTSQNLLDPLQTFLRKADDEPKIQMRPKKTRDMSATVSHMIDGDTEPNFKRRSAERHSFADFAARRSPMNFVSGYGSARLTDFFSSGRFKKKDRRKKINNGPSASANDEYGTFGAGSVGGYSIQSNSSAESSSRIYTEEDMREEFRKIMLEKNVPQSKVDQLVNSTPTEQMMTMIRNAKRTDDAAKKKQSPESNINALSQILKSENLLDCKQDIVTLRIQLQCQSVSFLHKFADEIRDERGQNGFELICELYSSVIQRLRIADCGSKHELELIDFLQEVVRCIRTIVNTYKGLEIVLRRKSPVCSLLIQTLKCLNRRKSIGQEQAEVRALRIDVATICSSLMLVSHETASTMRIEMTGQQKMFAELTALARQESKAMMSRFRPLVNCLQFFGERDSQPTFRILFMLNMLINAVDRNAPEDANWTEDTMWQMRMRLRSEAAKDGLNQYIEKFTAEGVDSKVREIAQKLQTEQNEDFETLVAKYENLKAEYDTLDGCFEMLAATAQASGVDNILLNILQLLVLTPEDLSSRRAFFKLIDVCVSEIVLHRVPFDPESDEKFVFETPIADIIEQLQDEEMSKKLRQATAAKQEAVVMQGEYWKTILELQKETEALRKHINDPKANALPPTTKVTVSAPSASSSLPTITGGPPPPPGLPPITGGPPPPPPPGGLPPITGGPPPPPPPGGLPPISGGPPPPPPPPPPGGRMPPPPPPPPMGLGKGPPPPPAPGMFAAPMAPALPEYLPPKKIRKVDIPMRKFPWGSNTINPRDIPRDSFWVSTNEDAVTNDRMFERLKNKFSSKPASSAASKTDVVGGGITKKIKTPQIIQDDKVLQRLGILQASVKMTHSELKKAILEVDEKVLTCGFLEQLRAALPPGDVLKKLQEVNKKQFEEMPEGEQFATKLAQINALPLRLDLIEFKMRFSEIRNELKPSMSSVMEACEEIRKSEGLHFFLQLLLAFGNFMSGSSKNYSNAYAFEFRMLTRLVDTKDVDNKHTLLQHLIEEMRRVDPKRARFAFNDFHHCIESSRVNADELAKSTRLMKINIGKLENCLKVYKNQGENDKFEEKMRPFLEKATKELATVEMMAEKMKSDWNALAKFYAFDVKKYPMEEFFSDIRTFCEHYAAAWMELDAEIEALRAEEKRKEKAVETQRRQKARQPLGERQVISALAAGRAAPRTPAAMIKVSTAIDKAGVLDELERATGNEAFLQTLISATNARTPRAGVGARSRTGRAALERQRSRGAIGSEAFLSSMSMAAPAYPSATSFASSGEQMKPQTSSTALERARAVGVGLPGQSELKMKIRRKGAKAVPVENLPTRNSQVSPTHKENREPDQDAVPSALTTDDLLVRLHSY